MISFSVEEDKVRISIDPALTNWRRTLICYWDAGSIIMADLIKCQLAGAMTEKIARIRKEAYSDGYKDGLKKRKSKDYFLGYW